MLIFEITAAIRLYSVKIWNLQSWYKVKKKYFEKAHATKRGQNLFPFSQEEVDLINMRIVRWLMEPIGKLPTTLKIPLSHLREFPLVGVFRGRICVCIHSWMDPCRKHCRDTSEVSAFGLPLWCCEWTSATA